MALCAAAKDNNVEEVKRLLENNANINESDVSHCFNC